MEGFNRTVIIKALRRLGELAQERSIELEISIYGGSAMMLAFNRKVATKDVDAIFQPVSIVQPLIAQVATEQHLPKDWLNNDVKQFLAPVEQKRPLPFELPGLKIIVPTASYLLAMKAMASRMALPGYAGDEDDLKQLIKKMNIQSVDQVQEHVDKFYPDDILSDSARALIQSIIDSINHS